MYEELAALGSATVHEAGGRLPVLDPALRHLDSALAAAGPAFTVRCGSRANLAIHRAVAAAPEAAMLVVDAGGDTSGYWGEILTAAALARRLGGLILDGGSVTRYGSARSDSRRGPGTWPSPGWTKSFPANSR